MRVLVVDEDPSSRETMGRFLAAWDFEPVPALSSQQAMSQVAQQDISIAVVADPVAGMASFDLVRAFRQSNAGVETILITRDTSADYATEAFRTGAYDCLSQPVDYRQLSQDLHTLREALQRAEERKTWEEELGSDAVLEGLVGFSAPMQAAFAAIRRLAKEESPVLITGLIGTGKEMAARALHALSPRASRPLVVYRCCGVTDALAGSELFGEEIKNPPRREKASLPGEPGAGVLESAGDGTLFLDEIGDLPLAIQAKLAQILREGRILPAGSRKPVPFHARVLATSRLNLAVEVRKGQFSKDLYRLLSSNTIHLPSLAERPEDVPLLCRFFLGKFNQEFGKKIQGFSPAAERGLWHYPWPGNVRELENVIGRACLLADEGRVEFPELSLASPQETSGWPERFPVWSKPKGSPDAFKPGHTESKRQRNSARASAKR